MKLVKPIEDRMSRYPWIAPPEMGTAEAVLMMERFDIRHLPVVEGDKVVGIISDRDLKVAMQLPGTASLTVSDLMSREPYCVDVGTPLSKVAREMARAKIGCAVVLGSFGRIVGVFTTVDGMRLLGELLTTKSVREAYSAGVERYLPKTHSPEW